MIHWCRDRKCLERALGLHITKRHEYYGLMLNEIFRDIDGMPMRRGEC